MKSFVFLDLRIVIPMSMALFLAYSAYVIERYNYKDYTVDKHDLEEIFLKIHPDLDHLDEDKWEECENLDAESLQRICFEVLNSLNITKVAFMTPEANFTYIPPPGEKSLQEERVLRRAPIKFRHFMNRNATGTLIHCFYKEMEFYLAQANGTHVFRLFRDVNDHMYYFMSGLHDVTFKKN